MNVLVCTIGETIAECADSEDAYERRGIGLACAMSIEGERWLLLC